MFERRQEIIGGKIGAYGHLEYIHANSSLVQSDSTQKSANPSANDRHRKLRTISHLEVTFEIKCGSYERWEAGSWPLSTSV